MDVSGSCIFCKIVNKQIPATVVSTSDQWMSFNDTNPQAPTHIVLIPKKHITNLAELNSEDVTLMGNLFLEATRITKEKNISQPGYRIVINCNADGGQTVSHLHLHILGGRRMTWPPG